MPQDTQQVKTVYIRHPNIGQDEIYPRFVQ